MVYKNLKCIICGEYDANVVDVICKKCKKDVGKLFNVKDEDSIKKLSNVLISLSLLKMQVENLEYALKNHQHEKSDVKVVELPEPKIDLYGDKMSDEDWESLKD